jgi:hypothetical protein
MPEIAAVAAFVSAGVALAVGIVNPLVAARTARNRQREQFEQERWLRQRDEVVAVLDTSADAASRCYRICQTTKALWKTGTDSSSENAARVVDGRHEAFEELIVASGRLALRFESESQIRVAYEVLFRALSRYDRTLHPFDRGEAWNDLDGGDAEEAEERAEVAMGGWSAAVLEFVSGDLMRMTAGHSAGAEQQS